MGSEMCIRDRPAAAAAAIAASAQGLLLFDVAIAEPVPALSLAAAAVAASGPASAASVPAFLWGLLFPPLLQAGHPTHPLSWLLFCLTFWALRCLEGLCTACGSLR